MSFRFVPFVVMWLLALCGPVSAQFGGFGEKAGAVKTSIVADTKAIEAGKPFTVGVRFVIERDWYIYWRFVGDIGMPTSVEWELPPGFKAGPLQWPTPKPHEAPGDFLNYVYEEETLLFAEITPPAEALSGAVGIKAKVAWQMCNAEQCVPGSANPALSIPAGAATPDNADLFAKWRAQIPKTEGAPFQVKWHREKADEFSIDITGLPKDFKAEFYPLPPSREVKPGHPKVSEIAADGARTISFPVEGGAPNLAWQGVLATSKGDAPREGWLIAEGDPISPAGRAAVATPPAVSAQPPLAFRALLAALGSAFVGGLLLNLMPCVLPVIGLKIYGFIGQAGEEPRRVFRLGLAFCAGVIVFFLALAGLVVAFAAGGHTLSYGAQFQNPYVLAGILAVVFVFSLSLLGVFEIGFGGEAATKLVTLAQREGYSGAFLHGLLTTLLGTACTGPLLGPVLAIAFLRPGIVTFLVLGTMAVGMALPYFILTAKPAWMKFLPRPGEWMERLKQLMGFLMLAIVIALLWLLGIGRDGSAIVTACAFLLVLGLASWVRGVWTRSAWSWLVALGLAAGGWMFLIHDRFDSRVITNVVWESKDGVSWQPSSRERVNDAVRRRQPVFIDFTADWCINCKINERLVLDTEPVRAAFKAGNFLIIKVDFTNKDPMIADWLHEYGRVGVPVYVIYDGKSPEPNVLPAQLLRQASLLRELDGIGG